MRLSDWRRASKLPAHETDMIIERVCGMNRMRVFLDARNYELSINEHVLLNDMYSRRLNTFEPLQYIIGYAYFMGYKFNVTPDVLIPRPDTEILVSSAVSHVISNNKDEWNILDLCTGSGCVGISISKELESVNNVYVTASDISKDALKIASANGRNLKADNIEFVQSDLFNKFDGRKFDIIVSNPPYIPEGNLVELHDEVRLYEPFIALCGGDCGYEFYYKINDSVRDYLNKDGHLFVEVGYDQSQYVSHIFSEFFDTEIIKDLNGYGRVVHMFNMRN